MSLAEANIASFGCIDAVVTNSNASTSDENIYSVAIDDVFDFDLLEIIESDSRWEVEAGGESLDIWPAHCIADN